MNESQAARAVVMVRPDAFFADPGTAATNQFQSARGAGLEPDPDTLRSARREFDDTVSALSRAGVETIVARPPADGDLPDAIFPNNWFSTHADGTVVLYPMLAPLRRRERQPALIDALSRDHGFNVRRVVDLSGLESDGEFVEGTGSLVLDRTGRVAYAARSPRTTGRALRTACATLGYSAIAFDAVDERGAPIYHTNVMLSIGSTIAVGCFESVADPGERRSLMERLESGGRTPLAISRLQMSAFAANVLELLGASGPVLAISTRAWAALDAGQRRRLEASLAIRTLGIDTIERVGGGGVRCMLAEIHLPRRPRA